jgi:uncharacterized membrane protein (DUF2068 family)
MARPTGITILGVLGILGGVFAFLLGVIVFLGSAFAARMLAGAPRFFVGVGAAMIGGFLMLYALLHIVVGIGLLSLANWARVLAIALAAIQLAFTALTILHGAPIFFFVFAFRRLIIAAIDILILWYLSQPHVKRAFGEPVAAA